MLSDNWLASPLFLNTVMVIMTIAVYALARRVYLKYGLHPLLQPILLGSAVVIAILLYFDISYQHYFASVQLLHWFLAPSIVALAIPLFYEARQMRRVMVKLCTLVCIGGVVTVLLALAGLWLFASSEETMLAMLSKSVTTAVAVLIAEETGAIASLAAAFVMMTGVFGAVVAPSVFRAARVKDDSAKGLALGLSAHAIGTVKAFEISPKCGAYAILAMIVNGIFTAILLPICFWLF